MDSSFLQKGQRMVRGKHVLKARIDANGYYMQTPGGYVAI